MWLLVIKKDVALKRPQMITSLKWDLMLWMTSNYNVEIQAQSMENEVERTVFCQTFSGHWSVKHGRFFRIPEERVDFQT
jgi:hypothetical protein